MNNVTPDPKLPSDSRTLLIRLYDYLREFARSLNQAADGRLFRSAAVSATYTASDNDHIILVSPGGTMTVTLPAASATKDKRIVVKRANSTTHTVTINVAGSGTIDNAASATLTTAYQAREFYSDGVQYREMLGATGGGTGTVTSVAQTVPAFLSVSGSPITTSGTLAISLSGSALPVTSGGTGVTSATAYAPLFGGTTSTGAFQSGTVGTSGHVLTSNGAGSLPTFQAPSASFTESFVVPITDQTTPFTSGAAKMTWRMPYAFTISEVRASVQTAQSSGSALQFDINESGTSILSTKLTIDNTEKTSETAATPPVISDSSIADDAELTFDIDTVGDGTAIGAVIYIIGTRT